MMQVYLFLSIFVLIALSAQTSAFRLNPTRANRLSSKCSSSLRMMISPADTSTHLDSMSTLATAILQNVAPSQAQKEFFFFFFAGSGALGIGGAQIPKLIKIQQDLTDLGGGQSKGGPELDVLTLGFPEALRVADVEEVIAKADIDSILQNGPKIGYMAQQGMMERVGMLKSLDGTNPLAVYAVFECFSGGGGDLANPTVADEMLEQWRKDGNLDGFKAALNKALLAKYAAFGTFAFLIFLVLDLIIESGAKGWPNGFFN